MTVELRIILVIVSFATAALMLRRIRRSKVRIEDSVFWIVLSAIILVMSIFPQIADACASALHIYLTTNFLFLFFIFVLLVKLFTMSVTVSQLETKLDRLVQEQALAEKERETARRETSAVSYQPPSAIPASTAVRKTNASLRNANAGAQAAKPHDVETTGASHGE